MSFFHRLPIIIGPASPEDAPQIAEINRESLINDYVNPDSGLTEGVWRNHTSGDWLERKTAFYRERIINTDISAVFVAKLGDEVLGFSMADPEEFTALYIKMEHRRKRLGALLTERVLQWEAERYTSVFLVVAPFVASAIRAHQSFGFKLVGSVSTEQVAGSPPGMRHQKMVLGNLALDHGQLRRKVGILASVPSDVRVLYAIWWLYMPQAIVGITSHFRSYFRATRSSIASVLTSSSTYCVPLRNKAL